MNRRTLLAVVLLALLAVFVWAVARNNHVGDPTPAPTSPAPSSASPTTPTVAPTVARDRTAEWLTLADRYVAAYQAGRTAGGEAWLARLRPVASPELVKAVAETDPERIVDSDPLTYVVEGETVLVGFRDGTWLRLHIGPAVAGTWWVHAVEGSRTP